MSDRPSRADIAGMSPEQMEAANDARLRRDYRDLTPAQRLRQVAELSRRLTAQAPRGRDH